MDDQFRMRPLKTTMSDNEIEDVSFLPGQTTGKRGVYEPRTPAQKCRQLILTKNRAILIISGVTIFILLFALIAAFARPGPDTSSCEVSHTSSTLSGPKTDGLATNGEKFPWTDIRLPKDVRPVTYDLYMHPNLTTFAFNGKVNIEIEAEANVDFIIIHIKHMNISKIEVREKDLDGPKIEIIKNLHYLPHEQLYIKLGKYLKKSQRYMLTIDFHSQLSDLLVGFYKSSYKNKKGETRWLATTHMEPTDARAAFPCFDEPQLKASFSMKMVRDQEYISLFNTELIKTEAHPVEKYLMVDHFAASVKMSTYLVAFVVCDYGRINKTTSNGKLVSVYTPPDQIGQAKFALEAAADILDYYEIFFGIPYPLNKQDLIAIPDFAAGAMENWGLITYRMVALLYDEEESSTSNQQWVAVVVAHELAHQWFGNYVTMQWWNDLWLNEGFASFVEYIGTDHIKPDWKMLDQFIADTLVAALHSDSLRSSHPISVEVNDPAEINEIFDQISYEKGSSIIRMMEGFLTRDVLEEGLKAYLQKYAYSNARTEDLWNSMSEYAKTKGITVDVKSVMDTWTRQMGYPVVNITVEGNKVTATQHRFLLNSRGTGKEEFESPYDYKWDVPLTCITSQSPDSPQPQVWMNRDKVSFMLNDSPKWVKMNVNFTGFYRVHYDTKNWDALTSQLQTDLKVFTSADRANLLDDAFSLARSGHLSAPAALDISRYLAKEEDYVPWTVALDNLNYIGALLESKPSYSYFSTYVKGLLSKLLDKFDWVDEGDHLTKYLRATVLGTAVKMNDPKAVEQAQIMYKAWMEGGKSISPNLKGVVYMGGIKYGGEAEWQHAWQQYKETDVPSEKRKLLYALSMTTDSLRLNRYLHLSLDEKEIRKGDTVMVITSIASNPAGTALAWRFVKQHWKELKRRYGDGSFDMSRLVTRTTSKFSTQYDYDEVKQFFSDHDSGSARRAVAQALESIEMNIDWLERNEKEAVQWLMEATEADEKPGYNIVEEGGKTDL